MTEIKRLFRGFTPPMLYKALRGLYKRKIAARHSDYSPVILSTQHFDPNSLACFIGQPIFSVPMRRVRYPGGIPYNHRYHHFVKYYRDGISALTHYYQSHQPKNIFEKHFLPAPDQYTEIHFENRKGWHLGVPWLYNHDHEVYTGEKGLGAEHGNQRYGPVSQKKIELEANRLDRVLKSIQEDGFKPHLYDGYPRGYFMVDEEGEWVFVIREGLHRVAALAHLKYPSIPVQFKPSYPRVIKQADCLEWPMVRKGYLTQENALDIFNQYISETPFTREDRSGKKVKASQMH